jgi:putative tricarboxylic transport membrane protein
VTGFDYAWTALTTTPAAFAAIAGVIWGMIGGSLPGISASIAQALLLPFTYGMDPTVAITLLASTYVGAEYGHSIPAILINTPGTHAAAATVADGYAMQRQGRGGEALGISLAVGVAAGLGGWLLLVGVTAQLADFALLFRPPSYFALGILGISVIATLTDGSLVKGFISGTIGLMIATIGTDPISGVSRYTFDQPELLNGIPYILIMIGVFAISELFVQTSEPAWERVPGSIRIKLPRWKMWKEILPSALIGFGVGSVEGCMPGAGGAIASFMAYNEAKRWSRNRAQFGHGAPGGVAAPEAANNTVACTTLIPTLSFGIPASNSTAVLLGGLLLHGMDPGPLLFTNHPDFVYGLFGGLLVANISLLFLGMLFMTPCLWLVSQPKPYLMAGIYAVVFSGVFAISNDNFDLGLILAAAVLGYAMRYFKFPVLPLVLGLILGYMIESNLRRSLVISGGHWSIFVEDPVSAILLSIATLFVAVAWIRNFLQMRNNAKQAMAAA